MIDTHAHIMFPEFREDFDAMLVRAKAAGVTKLLAVGCTIESSAQSLELCSKADIERPDWPQIYATLGVHPYDAGDVLHVNDQLMNKFFVQAKETKKVVAIGEVGLDYHRPEGKNEAYRETQHRALRLHFELARNLNLPMILHNRASEEDMLKILKEFPTVRAVMHCFSQDLDYAQEIWKLGHMTSFSGILTYPKNEYLRKVAASAPSDRILLETDCPFLAPQAYRGQRNEPAFMVETAKTLAEARGVTVDEIDRTTVRNTEIFFRLGSSH